MAAYDLPREHVVKGISDISPKKLKNLMRA
jgi:hypothetical protein